MPAAACGDASPRNAVYRRGQPQRTLLYRTVQTHLATWLALQLVATYAANVRRPGGHKHRRRACRGGVSAAIRRLLRQIND